MDEKNNIEAIRSQLNKAIELNSSIEEIIEISKLLDIQIVKFLEETIKNKKSRTKQ